MVYRKDGPKGSGRPGQYVGHHWYDDIVVLPAERRVMPDTVPHEEIAVHSWGCTCGPCERYPADLRRRLKRARLRSAACRSPR